MWKCMENTPELEITGQKFLGYFMRYLEFFQAFRNYVFIQFFLAAPQLGNALLYGQYQHMLQDLHHHQLAVVVLHRESCFLLCCHFLHSLLQVVIEQCDFDNFLSLFLVYMCLYFSSSSSNILHNYIIVCCLILSKIGAVRETQSIRFFF